MQRINSARVINCAAAIIIPVGIGGGSGVNNACVFQQIDFATVIYARSARNDA